MNSFTRGLSIAAFSIGLLGVTGCGEDNETEAAKLAKTAGDPGAANPKSKLKETPPGPGTEEGRGKAMMENQKNMLQEYPGKKN